MSNASTLQSGEVTSRQMGLVILASTLGAAIERYAFFLYGSMATLFPALFFPASDQWVGTLLAPLTFLVGFSARPFGGPVIGHLGDHIGRKSTLVNIVSSSTSLAFCHAWVDGPQAALFAKHFGTRSRYSGVSPGYQLATPFAGG